MRKFSWLGLVGLLWAVTLTAHGESPGKIKLIGGPHGAEARLNGQVVGELPLRHAVEASGTVLLELVVDGVVVHAEQVAVPPRARVRVRVPRTLSAPQPAAPTSPASDTEAGAGSAEGGPAAGAPENALADAAPPAAEPSAVAPVLQLRQLPKADLPQPLLLTLAPETADGPPAKAAPMRAETLLPQNVAAQSEPTGDGADRAPRLSPRKIAERKKPAGDEEEDEDDILDLFILETFAGPSFMAMALGQDSDVVGNLAALPESEASDVDLSQIQLSDVVRSVSETGTTVGGAASIRLAFISVGGRLSYSSYSSFDVMTVTGELALRAYSDPVEFYLGFGLGGGFLSNSTVFVRQTDGLALRAGLGLNFRFTKHTSFGVGADAVGWFLAGKGISPAQLGEMDQDSDHPIGGQVPVQANFSVLL